MRALWTATMAGSAVVIGLGMVPAQSLPLGGKLASPDAGVQQVQRGERGAGEFQHRERRARGHGERDRHGRRGGFYFGLGPDGPSFGYGQRRGGEFGYRERRERGYYDGPRRRRDF